MIQQLERGEDIGGPPAPTVSDQGLAAAEE